MLNAIEIIQITKVEILKFNLTNFWLDIYIKVIAEIVERTIGPPKKPKNLLSLTVVKPDKSGTTVVKNEVVVSGLLKLENSKKIRNSNPPESNILIVLNEILSRKLKLSLGKKINIVDEIKKFRIEFNSRLLLVNKNKVVRIPAKELKR